MSFLTATYTDVGTRKKTNQDSMLVMQANSGHGDVVMASVCDGMGGLAKGELASATMARALQGWFKNRLPDLLQQGFEPEVLWSDWKDLVDDVNRVITVYGEENHTNLGTTCVVLLIIGNGYYLMNVGDSRIYKISDNLYQLTKDQSFVQREIDEGRLTYQEALLHPDRSVLLQCIGATAEIHPEFSAGMLQEGEVFFLCSDGCHHVIMPQEFYQYFHPLYLTSKEIMEQRMKEIVALNIARNENDNISAILLKKI